MTADLLTLACPENTRTPSRGGKSRFQNTTTITALPGEELVRQRQGDVWLAEEPRPEELGQSTSRKRSGACPRLGCEGRMG